MYFILDIIFKCENFEIQAGGAMSMPAFTVWLKVESKIRVTGTSARLSYSTDESARLSVESVDPVEMVAKSKK
jgi:hypothetical protein